MPIPNLVRRGGLLALAAASVLTLAACENKVTIANYDQVTNGMSLGEVEKLLGKGADDTPSAGYGVSGGGVMSATASPEKVYVWKTDHLTVTVNFKDGKVVQKSKRE